MKKNIDDKIVELIKNNDTDGKPWKKRLMIKSLN